MEERSEAFQAPGDVIDQPITWEPSAIFLKYAVIALLIGAISFMAAVYFILPDQPIRAAGSGLAFALAIAGGYLLSRGRVHATFKLMAYGSWAVATVISLFTGGVRAPVMISYPLIILMVGWMISARAALALAVLTAATSIGFVLAESWGYLPAFLRTPPVLHGIVQVIIALLSAALIGRLALSYRNRLSELGKVGSDLAHRTRDLEASKAELNRAQEVGQVGSWIYDIVNDSIRLSAETCRIFGLREGTTGSHARYMALTLAQDREAVDLAWQSALTGAAFDHEHRITGGASVRWVRQKAEIEFAPDGTARRAVGVVQDITERKQTEELLKASEMRFRSYVENANDVLFSLTPTGVFSYVSPQWKEAFGYELGETIGQPFVPFIHPDDAPGCMAFLQRAMDTGRKQSGVEYRVHCKNGSYKWYTANGSLIKDPTDGTPTFVGIGRDIGDRKQIEDALKESEFRWKFAIEGSGDGVWDTNIQTGESTYSRRWKEMLGYAEAEIPPVRKEWTNRIHPDDQYRVAAAMQGYLAGRAPIYVVEFRLRCKDDSYKWILSRGMVVSRDNDGKALRMIGTHTDITERKQMEEQVRQMAFYDTLTQLPNRRLLNDRLSQTMAANKRSGCYGAVMFLDLDNFKPLNDTHGHEVGDLLLIEVANRLKACVREMDTVARFGGDEFVVIASELDTDQAESAAQAGIIAEKIRTALADPYRLTLTHEGKTDVSIEHRCTASIGVALFINHETSQDDILKWADMAMYRAKEAGRNAIRFHELTPAAPA